MIIVIIIKTMNQRPAKIDESIKVSNWGSESPTISPTNQHNFFQKYAANRVSSQEQLYPNNQMPEVQVDFSQPNPLDMNFKRLKSQQLEKLRNLKSEYEQIKNIKTNEYVIHKHSNSSSLKSSGLRSDFNDRPTSEDGKIKENAPFSGSGGREYQIVELQKKQLQIMLQNSMKKIEELLHKEMQYKKTIHELKLQKESRALPQVDGSGFTKLLKKKQRQFYDQIRGLQLQRETLLYNMAGLKEKVKYLESKLTTSEQELRKILQEKRNYEELIRMQKDKLMNLEIELRRERKEHEIMEKDKNAEINMLLKERDIKASIADKQLRTLTANLQQQLKIKEKRYTLLLQQLQKLQKDKLSEDKEQEVKIVNEILSKNTSEGPNKALQQTINSIIARLNELQTKPAQRQIIQDLINQNLQINQRKDTEIEQQIFHYKQQMEILQNRLLDYERKIACLQSANQALNNENAQVKGQKQNLVKKNKVLIQSEYSLKQQLERVRLIDRKMSNASSRQHLHVPTPLQKEESSSKYQFLTMKIGNLEKQIQNLNQRLEESYKNVQSLEDENRNLLNKVSRVEFQMNKTKQEGEFQLNLAVKTHQTNYKILLQDFQVEKSRHTKAQQQIVEMKKYIQDHMEAGRRQIARLNFRIEGLLREKSSFDAQLKAAFNGDLDRIKKQYKGQIQSLSSEVKSLNEMNKELQQQYNRSQYLVAENEDLKHSLKTMRLENNFNTPKRGEDDNNIMSSIAQHFGGQQQNKKVDSQQNIMNSLFAAFNN